MAEIDPPKAVAITIVLLCYAHGDLKNNPLLGGLIFVDNKDVNLNVLLLSGRTTDKNNNIAIAMIETTNLCRTKNGTVGEITCLTLSSDVIITLDGINVRNTANIIRQ